MRKKIVIIGVGFLGGHLYNFLGNFFDVVGVDIKCNEDPSIKKIDVTNDKEISFFLKTQKPDVIINTVAMSSYFACERNYEMCRKLNYNVAINILKVCNDIGAKLIFISSSYVFDGEKGNYLEEDMPNASNHYSILKIAAESEILKNKKSIVIRSEPMYGYDDSRKKLVIGTNDFEGYFEIAYPDLLRCPIFINDIPRIIHGLLINEECGIFNVAGKDKLRWIDFVSKLDMLSNKFSKIKIVDSTNWKLKPPYDTTLNITKIKDIGMKITSFTDALGKLRKLL